MTNDLVDWVVSIDSSADSKNEIHIPGDTRHCIHYTPGRPQGESMRSGCDEETPQEDEICRESHYRMGASGCRTNWIVESSDDESCETSTRMLLCIRDSRETRADHVSLREFHERELLELRQRQSPTYQIKRLNFQDPQSLQYLKYCWELVRNREVSDASVSDPHVEIELMLEILDEIRGEKQDQDFAATLYLSNRH
jgi:hypothetical protein